MQATLLETIKQNEAAQRTAALAIYREIMSASLALEKDLTIAYFGPEATNTHQAARSKFGASVHYTPKVSIASLRERRDMAYLLESILCGEPLPGQCHGSDTRVDALCIAFHGQGKRRCAANSLRTFTVPELMEQVMAQDQRAKLRDGPLADLFRSTLGDEHEEPVEPAVAKPGERETPEQQFHGPSSGIGLKRFSWVSTTVTPPSVPRSPSWPPASG